MMDSVAVHLDPAKPDVKDGDGHDDLDQPFDINKQMLDVNKTDTEY